MKKKRSLIGTGIILLACFAVVVIVVANLQTSGQSRESAAAQLTLNRLQDLEPVTVDFAEKPTVLLFFTSWCPYCQEDAPKMVTLHEKYKDELNLYGINLAHRDEESEVKQYVQSFQIEYPILLDEDGEVYAQYAGNGFPSLYFFDSEGNVIQELVGATDIDTIEQLFVSFLEGYH